MGKYVGSYLRVRKTIVGKSHRLRPSFEVNYDAALLAVDELIQPPDVSEFLAPGFIDLQVNGFAGVDYNDPSASHEAIAQSIRTMFETGVTRFFPTLITGSEERMSGRCEICVAARSSFAAAGHARGARDGGHSRGRSAHLARRRAARGASARTCAASRQRRIQTLAGSGARGDPPGDGFARVGGGAGLHTEARARRRRGEYWPHQGQHRPDPRRGGARARPCRLI